MLHETKARQTITKKSKTITDTLPKTAMHLV
jgi:hypothetical protein